MHRYAGGILALGMMGGPVVLLFGPLEDVEDSLRERLGGFEHVGWFGVGLRVLYTVFATVAVLAVLFVVFRQLRSRVSAAADRIPEWFAGPLVAAILYWLIILPVFTSSAIGLANVAWDTSTPRVERYRYLGTTRRSKGPSAIKFELASDPTDTLTLSHVGPGPGASEGAAVTLFWHTGALGMPFISSRP